jgi:4-hydroxy-tetrahydrodipicolinate reductase
VRSAGDLEYVGGVELGEDLAAGLASFRPDVAVDFTHPSSAMPNLRAMVAAGVRPVVGTTGFTPADLDEARALCRDRSLGGLIAPNFSLGAVLLMRFAATAARWFPHVEIVELHHDRKADAPSGTALKTAELVARARGQAPIPRAEDVRIAGARGGQWEGVTVHSIRLPGLVAHQEVIFGSEGQVLTLRHDTMDRKCFMPGVLLGIREVPKRRELVYGLENLLPA